MSGVTAAAWANSQSGRLLGGRWRLGRLLGLGGSAAVFEATHRNGKRVAIKVLRPERAQDERARARFLREGYAANRVGHARVVSVDDDGWEEDGTAFLVMELLVGEPLDVLASRSDGKLPWQRVAALTTQVLEVLEAAHLKGIVHRDIKPANLFWAEGTGLRVLDFGLAQVPCADDGLVTQDGALLGTPAFMAPEQARAAASSVTELTDLWAVGATAFTLLSGRKVHEASTVDEQLAIAAINPAPNLAKLVPDIPPAVAAVWQRALEYDTEKRWPSAGAMSKAMASALGGDPTSGVEYSSGDVSVTTVQHEGPTSDSLGPVSRGRPRQARGRARSAVLVLAALAAVGMFVRERSRAEDGPPLRPSVASSDAPAMPAAQSAAPLEIAPLPPARPSAPPPRAATAARIHRSPPSPRAAGGATSLIEEPPF